MERKIEKNTPWDVEDGDRAALFTRATNFLRVVHIIWSVYTLDLIIGRSLAYG